MDLAQRRLAGLEEQHRLLRAPPPLLALADAAQEVPSPPQVVHRKPQLTQSGMHARLRCLRRPDTHLWFCQLIWSGPNLILGS